MKQKNKAEAAPASGQHTPGPWHISRTARGHVRMIRCERTLPKAIEGLAVAKIVHAVGFDEEQANARLIAAAPELLEALRECRPWVRKWSGASGLLAMVDTAITKAERRGQ